MKRFEPEGILGTLNSVVLCYLGAQAGRTLMCFKGRHTSILSRLTIWGIVLVSRVCVSDVCVCVWGGGGGGGLVSNWGQLVSAGCQRQSYMGMIYNSTAIVIPTMLQLNLVSTCLWEWPHVLFTSVVQTP